MTEADITVGLWGPDPRTLWIVNEGSRQRDLSEAAESWVTDSNRRNSTTSSSSRGRTLSSVVQGWR